MKYFLRCENNDLQLLNLGTIQISSICQARFYQLPSAKRSILYNSPNLIALLEMFARVSKKTEGFFSTFYEKKLAISLNKKMSSSAICSCTINLLYIHVIIICLSILSRAKAAAEGLQSNVWTRLFCISHVYLHYL